MVRIREALTYANVMATVAVFVALGGSSYAAITLSKNSVKSKHIAEGQVKRSDIGKNAVTSVKVRDFSLLATDFAPGQLSAGPQGPKGEKGEKGDKGDTGAAATKLFVNVRPDCASFEDSSRVVGVALEAAARCDVRFDRDVTGCVAAVTLAASPPGELLIVEPGDDYGTISYQGLDNDEVAIVYMDSAGAIRTSQRPPFSLTVFC